MIELRETATAWEVARAVLPLLGIGVNLWAVLDAWGDRSANAATDDALTEARGIAARQAIRNICGWLAVLATLAALGAHAMTVPPINPDVTVTRVGVALTIGYAVIAAIASAWAIWDRVDRRRLIASVRRRLSEVEGC